MDKKASLQLGVNAIIILIIALAVMGLVVGFVSGKFQELGGQVEISEQPGEVSAGQPFGLPGGGDTLTLQQGKDNKLKLKVHNTASDSSITGLAINCSATDGNLSTDNGNITGAFKVPSTDTREITTIVSTPWQKGEYACMIYGTDGEGAMRGTSQSMFVKVR